MTETASDVIEDIDLENIDTAAGHIKCCERDAFFCELPFDPEFVVDKPDEACSTCNIIYGFMGRCGKRTTKPHQHCPFMRKVCGR